MAAARSAVYLRTASLWGEGRYYFLRRAAPTSLGRLLEEGAVRKREVAAQGAVELLLWGVFFYSWGRQIKSGAKHRRLDYYQGAVAREEGWEATSALGAWLLLLLGVYYFSWGIVWLTGG